VNEARDFTVKDFPHGEVRGYKKGCRCTACSVARSKYDKTRIDHIDKTATDYPHGTRLGARNGCKCNPCLDAKRIHEKSYLKERSKTVPEFKAWRRTQARINQANRRAQEKLTEEDKPIVSLIYDICPDGYEVDHIIPLSKGGRHAPDNLQYLTHDDNIRKGNRDIDYSAGAIRWQTLMEERSTTIP